MTTASELKSAAVVEVESEVRKTDAVKKNNNALELDERCSRHDDTSFKMTTGSTTATATTQVASAKAEAKVERATSGSKAASTFSISTAAMRATRLPVSGFPQNSPLFLIQKNPALLGRSTMPERFLRARSAA